MEGQEAVYMVVEQLVVELEQLEEEKVLMVAEVVVLAAEGLEEAALVVDQMGCLEKVKLEKAIAHKFQIGTGIMGHNWMILLFFCSCRFCLCFFHVRFCHCFYYYFCCFFFSLLPLCLLFFDCDVVVSLLQRIELAKAVLKESQARC